MQSIINLHQSWALREANQTMGSCNSQATEITSRVIMNSCIHTSMTNQRVLISVATMASIYYILFLKMIELNLISTKLSVFLVLYSAFLQWVIICFIKLYHFNPSMVGVYEAFWSKSKACQHESPPVSPRAVNSKQLKGQQIQWSYSSSLPFNLEQNTTFNYNYTNVLWWSPK